MSTYKEMMHFIDKKIQKDIQENKEEFSYSQDFYEEIYELTERLLDTKNYIQLAYIYETLGTLSRNMYKLMGEANHSMNYMNVMFINLSCYCYYAASKLEYSKSLAMSNFNNHIEEIELIEREYLKDQTNCNNKFVERINVLRPYNIELLGDICSFFDTQKATYYYAQSKRAFEKVPLCDQGGETNDYYFEIYIELNRVIKSCLNTNIIFSQDGIERINQKESLMCALKVK